MKIPINCKDYITWQRGCLVGAEVSCIAAHVELCRCVPVLLYATKGHSGLEKRLSPHDKEREMKGIALTYADTHRFRRLDTWGCRLLQ